MLTIYMYVYNNIIHIWKLYVYDYIINSAHRQPLIFIFVYTGDFLPDHVGLPLAEDERSTFFMLEIHYDNPMLHHGTVKHHTFYYYFKIVLKINYSFFSDNDTQSYFPVRHTHVHTYTHTNVYTIVLSIIYLIFNETVFFSMIN